MWVGVVQWDVDPGWSRDCLLTLPVTTEQSTTGLQFAIQVSGCYCYRGNKGVPEVAKLTAVTTLKPNADYGVQLMVSKRFKRVDVFIDMTA